MKKLERFPPCDFIKEEMRSRGWNIGDLAKNMGVSSIKAAEVYYGTQKVTQDIAQRLSGAFRTSADIWINLQNSYDSPE